MRKVVLALAAAVAGRRLYRLYVAGAITVDLGVGRTTQPLGPVTVRIAAPRELVFDVIAAPYLGRTPRALQQKLQVWERGSDMVLAAHFTPGEHGLTTTVETVRFERPGRVTFRLLRGPVPHVAESFALAEVDVGTELVWEGQLGTDLWALGAWWGARVAASWTKAVQASLQDIAAEAERRAARARG
jgi:hypothetical protein